MKNIRNYPEFTHFACIPFIEEQQRELILGLQKQIRSIFETKFAPQCLSESNYKLGHVTISMLTLHRQQMRQKFTQIFEQIRQTLSEILTFTRLTFSKVGYFSKWNQKTKKKQVSLLYLEIQKDNNFEKIERASDTFIRAMLRSQIIINTQLKQMRIRYEHKENLYKNQEYHLTLFRVKNIEDNQQFKQIFQEIEGIFKETVFQCRSFDVSTRNHYQKTGFYTPFQQIQLKLHQ